MAHEAVPIDPTFLGSGKVAECGPQKEDQSKRFRNAGIVTLSHMGQYYADNNALRLLDCRPHGNASLRFRVFGASAGKKAFSVRRRERGVDRLDDRV